ncbi:MAG: DsrE family protein [Brevundimonas sp.]
MKALLLALSLVAAVTVSPAFAQAVPGYGGFTPLPEAGEQPVADRVYKVIFDVSQGGADDASNRGLDRVARMVNILAAGGVDADHREVVVVVHGAATLSVLSDAAWAARGKGAANPNSALIRALIAAGVQVRICGQAMIGNRVADDDLAPGVAVDLAALMTVVHLQQAGYALIAD